MWDVQIETVRFLDQGPKDGRLTAANLAGLERVRDFHDVALKRRTCDLF